MLRQEQENKFIQAHSFFMEFMALVKIPFYFFLSPSRCLEMTSIPRVKAEGVDLRDIYP